MKVILLMALLIFSVVLSKRFNIDWCSCDLCKEAVNDMIALKKETKTATTRFCEKRGSCHKKICVDFEADKLKGGVSVEQHCKTAGFCK